VDDISSHVTSGGTNLGCGVQYVLGYGGAHNDPSDPIAGLRRRGGMEKRREEGRGGRRRKGKK